MEQSASTRKRPVPTPGFVPLPDGTFEPLPAIDPQQRYSINEASAYLRQSREKTYADIRSGKLQAITDGRKFISGRELVRRAQ